MWRKFIFPLKICFSIYFRKVIILLTYVHFSGEK